MKTLSWRQKHPERAKEQARKYREAHREEINEYARNWKSSGKGKQIAKTYREKNRDKISEYHRKRRKTSVQWISEYKKTLVCSRCPENHPRCLDFHHVDPSTKRDTVRKVLLHGGKDAALKEIKKCVVLCANCHRKEHSK